MTLHKFFVERIEEKNETYLYDLITLLILMDLCLKSQKKMENETLL